MVTVTMATLDTLPTEVLFNVCSFLKPEEVSNLSKVNKKLYTIHFDVLKSIEHLEIDGMAPAEAVKCIFKYKNITTLNICGLALKEIFRLEKGRNKFVTKLAITCPKIQSFTVSGLDGLDLVRLYIISRNERVVTEGSSSTVEKGIKNLHVASCGLKKRINFLRVSQRIRDIVQVSSDFNCLTMDSSGGSISQNAANNPQIKDCWVTIGTGIKGFVDNRFDVDVVSLTILPSLRNLKRLTLFFVSVREMDLLTTNNPGLESFTCSYLRNRGFVHIRRLTQLKHLKIGYRLRGEISKDDIDNIFDGVSGSLLTIEFGVEEWNRSFMAIGEKCRNLRRVSLSVGTFDDEDIADFRGSFGDDVDVRINGAGKEREELEAEDYGDGDDEEDYDVGLSDLEYWDPDDQFLGDLD